MPRDSSFPTIDHKAILNELNSKSKTNRKRTNIDNENKPQQKQSIALERLVINYWGGGEGGLKPVLHSNNLTLGSDVDHIHIEVVRSA